jgi:O-antigen biosynthesis protein
VLKEPQSKNTQQLHTSFFLATFQVMMLSRSRHMKVLIIGYVWPELTSSAAGLRDWNLVKTFQQQQWQVLYSSQSKENQFSKQLENEGVTTVRHASNDSKFDEWIKKEQPDFVVYDRYVTEEQFGWRVKEHSPSTVQVLDTQDLHFLRKQRQVALEKGEDSLDGIAMGEIELQSDTTLRELASIYRSDCTILISDFELQLLTKKFNIPSSLLHLSRLNYGPSGAFRPLVKRTRDFCMIGNFRHAPNYDATLWLKEKIWPLIRAKLPTAEVDIYGAYPPKEMMDLTSSEEGFHVRGPVKDHMSMFKKYRINLAPLRFGAGIKGKISDG